MPFLVGFAAESQDGHIGTMIASSYGSCIDVAYNAGDPYSPTSEQSGIPPVHNTGNNQRCLQQLGQHV